METRTKSACVARRTRQRMLPVLTILLACGMVTLASVDPAQAQNDHLTCYKAKDTAKVFQKAAADLIPLQSAEFATENCELKAGSKTVCIPSQKLNVSVVDGQDDPFAAQDLTDIQLCYKIKCPKVALPPLTVSDQFGTRSIEKFKASRLCVPAAQN